MKHLHYIILAVTLLFSQWGAIDHVYHEHTVGEVCDYCVSGKSFDHAAASSVQATKVIKQKPQQEILLQASITKSITRHFAVRAPPRYI